MIIETDIKELFKKKDIYQPAQIVFMSADDTIMVHAGEIRTRGNARKDICVLPPTKLRFQKDWLQQKNLSDFATIKLVNACTLSERDRDYVIAEQLIYQVAEIISSHSFRTHPITLQYLDAKGKRKPIELEGFMIEHEDQMAQRLDSKVYEVFFKKELLDRHAYVHFSVFQYMIGNTDWKIINHHNLRVITNAKEKKAIPIPYDFDYAGLVKTHYAVPHSRLDIKSVTERLYLGPCQTKDEVETTCQYFLTKEAEIMALFDQVNMGNYQSKFSVRYLKEFFDLIRSNKQAERIFTNCMDY